MRGVTVPGGETTPPNPHLHMGMLPEARGLGTPDTPRNMESLGVPVTCQPGHRPPPEPPDAKLGELEGPPELDTSQTLHGGGR